MNQLVVISGCSGGGKSALLEELRVRGHAVVDEPGRRVVREQLAEGGVALPWVDMIAFASRAQDLARKDYLAAVRVPGRVFFDRGLIDAAAALEHFAQRPALRTCADSCRYHPLVFMVPPWREIFAGDPERRHGYFDAVAEFDRLMAAYRTLGYRIRLLPKLGVQARADIVLSELAS
ncbi:AAA family ATPase [Ancylobacter dichloromethanicus]|uniref:ATPase n=1 Tax=Ancylobacter dichloromethanicus TaxID=518825 RepID=A0A9W6MYT8_9HYPH|nr:AAA family ATPase [Ancylobacter dichloromethanicus]MBS7554172.1 AAA family ATPase [Ancylobacter dichloromethanicus]GLK71292.1 ATPase [Ancylobacter dichloromethanicus]